MYTVNNPLRYVDPTGEDGWNPFSWGQAIAEGVKAVGQALASINPLEALDMATTVLGFIPGVDVVSNAYVPCGATTKQDPDRTFPSPGHRP